jgi:hypothetical protein
MEIQKLIRHAVFQSMRPAQPVGEKRVALNSPAQGEVIRPPLSRARTIWGDGTAHFKPGPEREGRLLRASQLGEGNFLASRTQPSGRTKKDIAFRSETLGVEHYKPNDPHDYKPSSGELTHHIARIGQGLHRLFAQGHHAYFQNPRLADLRYEKWTPNADPMEVSILIIAIKPPKQWQSEEDAKS